MVDESGAIVASRVVETPADPDSTRIEILPGALHYLEGVRLSDLAGLPMEEPVFADRHARAALTGGVVRGAATRSCRRSARAWARRDCQRPLVARPLGRSALGDVPWPFRAIQ